MRPLQHTILLAALTLLAASPLAGHEGMIAFFSDQSASSCQVILPEYGVIKLPLFYIRGDGPRFGQVCKFRVLRSSTGMELGYPEFSEEHGLVSTLGNLETGITIGYHFGYEWCAPEDEDAFYLCTIPIFNLSDPDTFTVTVAENIDGSPACHTLTVVPCEDLENPHEVIGGTFVFNGDCHSPEEPFALPTAAERSSWGAIKELCR